MVTVRQKTEPWIDTKRIHALQQLTLTGSYPLGGDPVDLSNIKGTQQKKLPIFDNVVGLGGNKYSYSYINGTTLSNGVLKITDTTTGLELAPGAYPAALLAEVLTFYAVLLR